ncbi:MAG: hypothetical protein ABIT10_09125 [Alteraurantiacibacter sp.]
MIDITTKGALTAKTWQTPELMSLDCGLASVNGVTPNAGNDGVTSSTS